MTKRNYRLWGIILVLAVVSIITTSIALASDMRVAVAQNKPVLRGAPTTNIINLQGSTNITKSNPKITLSLKNTNVQPVLRMFADKAGLNIVFHNSATGNVTLDLVNVPLNDAFRMVLQVTNLTYYQDGKTLIISSQDFARSSGWSKQNLSTVPVNYVDAALIANFLNQNIFSKNTPGLSNWDVVVTNATRNELLVFGTPNDLAMVKKIVAKFDVPPLDTTFTVKHTTPAEMAELVCNMLRMTQGVTDQASQSTKWDSSTAPATNQQQKGAQPSGLPTGLAANIQPARKFFNFGNKGSVTGFASSSSSSSSSSSRSSSSGSSSGGSSSGSSSSISLGKNVIACTLGGVGGAGSTGGGSGSTGASAGSGSGASSGATGSGASSGSSGASSGSGSVKISSFGNTKMIVSYFTKRGTINILGGSQNQLKAISEFIAKNDVKQPQALMDITILELTETGTKAFENQWYLDSPNFTATFSGGTTTTPRGENNVPTVPIIFGPDGTYARPIGPTQVRWAINYVLTNNKGRVVANPKIMLTNGEASEIDITESYVEKVTSQFNEGTSLQPTTTKEYDIADDLGLQFTITPFISPAGYLSIDFDADYSTKGDAITDNGDLQAQLIKKRTVNLKNLRIKDNETLIIGGLVQEDEQKNVGKIPFLGDIPIIGAAFRSTRTEKVKTELVIMLTPKIMKDSEDIGTNYKSNYDDAL